MNKRTILIVDDDAAIQFAFQKTFSSMGFDILTAGDGQQALDKIQETCPDLVFLDVAMPGMDGLDALEQIKTEHPDLPVVIITGYGNMETAIRAMQCGAYDYLTKPLDIEKVRVTAQRALEMREMRRKINVLQQKLEDKSHEGRTILIGKNPRMQEIFKKIGVLSTSPNTTNILILGETGTGKELVARVIHESGPNADEPFVAINCTVLPETLLESELFGHEKGAFTGADRSKPGKFELAGKGTLFLDEVGDMPEALQKKLLRVIQERCFERLGSNQSIPLEARLIAATHHNLSDAVQKGTFREDLYYRLNVVAINLPPLRERKEDIPLLATYFLQKYGERFGKKINQIDPEAMELLMSWDYPGNIRELENLIERAVALERGSVLTRQSFPLEMNSTTEQLPFDVPILTKNFQEAKRRVIDAFEKKYLTRLLEETGGNVSHAARISGLERQSFQRLMKKHNITSSQFRRK
ncbi:MAG: sigma-54-dependent Fis family transcriptional regulator [Calditrichaeota bacterium]|nr:MAG: sigma-54-dependent Fis family transcriptional regulator [Calditrichota bacterium]